ncbi:MAG: helix-turn-helix domain-containing protein [Patescibacteria group bacterium]
MNDELVKELQEIGLSDKEAKVYLAALELGSATAQQIAVKAIVNRPTAYVMIESLIHRGLMSRHMHKKKTMLQAAMPHKLFYIVESQIRDLQKKETTVKNIIKKINDQVIIDDDNNEIRFEIFSGDNHPLACQDYILRLEPDEVLELTSIEQKCKLFTEKRLDGDIRNKICKKHRVFSLFSSNEPLCTTNASLSSMIFKEAVIDNNKYPIGAEIIVCNDSVFFTTYNKHLQVLMIRNEGIAQTMKTLYKNLWKKGHPINKNKK